MNCRRLLLAVGLLSAGLITTTSTAHAVSTGRALILAGTVTGGASSVEGTEAASLGLAVDVVDAATWSAMTAAQFASYQVIILGDPTCSGLTTDTDAAAANAKVWGSVINGNVVIIGTDPVYHNGLGISPGGGILTQRGVDFAANHVGKTGVYITLSCYYHGTADHTPVPLLDGIGSGGFSVTGVGCFDNAHIVARSPALTGLVDADISNWSCSVHEAFETWPGSLVPLAIAKDFSSSFTASDGTQGPPYILAGGDIKSFPLSLSPLSFTRAVGGTHTVTATLLDGVTSAPVSGALIHFQVTSGPNAGVVGTCDPATCATKADGTASFAYTSNGAVGADSIQAFFDVNGNGTADPAEPQTTAGVSWRVPNDYVPLVPARLLDTRPAGPGISTIDGKFLSGGVVPGGTTFELQVGGRGGVDLDAKAAVLNVTVTQASDAGFLTVFPCGVPVPTASNLNYTAGSTVPNAVISKLGTDGKVCLFAQRTTHVIVDVSGEIPAVSSYEPLGPSRLLDTRPAGPGIATVDGQFVSGGVVAGGTTLELQVGTRGGVDPDAKAAVLNVTVTEPSDAGFLTVFPCGVPIPTASNINYAAGSTVPNVVISKLGTDGKVCLFAQRTTHLIVDVNGEFPTNSTYEPLLPARLLDTRPAGPGIATTDNKFVSTGAVAGGTTLVLQVGGRGAVPLDAKAAVLNVTVTEPSDAGFLTVFPCGVPIPTASNLNNVVGGTVANAVISKLAPDGTVCLFAQRTTHVIVDVNGVT